MNVGSIALGLPNAVILIERGVGMPVTGPTESRVRCRIHYSDPSHGTGGSLRRRGREADC